MQRTIGYIKFIFRTALLCVLLFASKQSFSQTDSSKYAAALNVFGIDGAKQSLSNFKGKKIWVLVLPDSLNAASVPLINSIDSVAKSNAATMQTILVPSLSVKGLAYDTKMNFGKYYTQLKQDGILIAAPMKTKKGERANQKDNMLNWLTDPNRNGHFNKEPDGNGTMYLIDAQGNVKCAVDLSYINNSNALTMIFQ